MGGGKDTEWTVGEVIRMGNFLLRIAAVKKGGSGSQKSKKLLFDLPFLPPAAPFLPLK